MWRKHLALGLLTVIAGIWFASWQGYTPHLSRLKTFQDGAGVDFYNTVKDNLRQHLNNHHHLMVAKGHLKLAALPSKLFSAGDPYLIFFSAKKEDQVNQEEDLYTMKVYLGSNAYPISFSPPRNLTENPLSKDLILDLKTVQDDPQRNGVHLLYGQMHQEMGCRAINYLHWDYEDQEKSPSEQGTFTKLFSGLSNEHIFDRNTLPQWLSVRFKYPLKNCQAVWLNKNSAATQSSKFGRGSDKYRILSGDKEVVTIDTITQTMTPIRSNLEIVKPPQNKVQSFSAFQEALRAYDLLNLDEDLSLSGLKSNLATQFEKNLYELLVNENDPRQHQAVGEVSSILDGRRPNWYPPRIDVKSGFPGEGQWQAIKLFEDGDPLILKTYIRLDPERPYHSIYLYAMDMRRLGLRFVAGGNMLEKKQEGVGTGRFKREDQGAALIAFNGGPKIEHINYDGAQGNYQQGQIQDHQILVPTSEGLPTLAIDQKGRLAMGRLDVEELPMTWSSFRQSYAPLVDLRIRDRKFVPPQSPKGRLDHLHLTRSALGINSQGTLIYAWSEATNTEFLAQALRLVGVRFAMSLKSDTNQIGLAVYPDSRLEGKQGQEKPAHSKMQLDPQQWRTGAQEDFFYLVLAQSLPYAFAQRPANWREGEGVWKKIKYQDVNPWLATSFVNADHVGTDVKLLIIDGERLQLNLSLGGHRSEQNYKEERPLPAEPVARIPLGFTSQKLGLVSIKQKLQEPILGKMTWVVDEQGKSTIGRWGQDELRIDGAWQDLLQGEAIIDQGKAIDTEQLRQIRLTQTEEDPDRQDRFAEPHLKGSLTALGITGAGDLIFAQTSINDIKALQKTMILAGVQHALRLNYQGSAETGQHQFFYRHLGQTFYNSYPDLALKPAKLQTSKSALIGIDDALIITPKSSLSRARFVDSFKELQNESL